MVRRIFGVVSKLLLLGMSAGRRNAESEDGWRGAVAVAGDGLGVVERVEHVLRAGEGVGVSPGCEIGVGEVVLVPDGLE